MRRLSSFGIAGLMMAAPALQTGRMEVNECAHLRLNPSPGWSVSAAWTHNGGELLVVDNTNRSILRYSAKGQPLGEIRQSWGGLSPSTIKPYGSGFLLGLAENKPLVELDNRYGVRDTTTFREDAGDKARTIESLFLWHPAGGDLVTFSDIRIATQWRSGFFRFPRSHTERFTELLEVPWESRVFYRLGYPYIASLGETAFFLSMEKGSTKLFRSGRGQRPKQAGVRNLVLSPPPVLPKVLDPANYSSVMQTVEKSKMPAGIFGWEGFLYVLAREPDDQGTRWSLTKVDPWKEVSLGTKILSTRANHLTVAPGPSQWAFLEKGPVRGWRAQEIGRVLLVPASRLRAWRVNEKLCE